ncbi:MAG TPA: tRNA (cytidine(34)-2'-O)-methyltransferase [Kiritimatiellia bacterium]|nr:tRNA (cytidine(34)-2'-O)-methyltransferase [Kiritimatiellia bacterium]HMO98611.1 tRNA (cytidine(34)-2'-O)-methyltransferase [Kiritimatiellia bacterium]HMP96361.1 tRNA (cytidine(34)-2'-O)-methyltransferase [Kiritimatiellia bacterium]
MKHAHTRKFDHPFHWPDPPLQVVLVEPEIPPNTGNIARMCAATGSGLHLIEPLGFRLDDAKLKRAGLDYWDAIAPVVHPDWDAYERVCRPSRFFLFSTGGTQNIFTTAFQPGDHLVFGPETRGLSDALLARYPDRIVGIPLQTRHVRSLNLSTAAGIAVYEALRQINAGRGADQNLNTLPS